jgi:hypothetical protein
MGFRKAAFVLAAACGTLTAGVVGASPASAAQANCIVVTTHCESAIVRANSTSHDINWKASAGNVLGANWRVVDVDNGAIVGSGFTRNVNPFFSSGRITGLYGYYRIEIYNATPGAYGQLYN